MKQPRAYVFALAIVALACGCARIAFVSNRLGHSQIFSMTTTGGGQTDISRNNNEDSSPDVSLDGKRIAYSSVRNGEQDIYVSDFNDIGGASERKLTTGAAVKRMPRWSPRYGCQPPEPACDVIAYSEADANNRSHILIVATNVSPTTPLQVTWPTGSESDGGGHDFYDNGYKIVFARRTASSDLYSTYFNGTQPAQRITNTPTIDETLPVVSHDGRLLAYRVWVPLTTGGQEAVQIVETGTWAAHSAVHMQAPVETGSIAAIDFSCDDTKLIVAARSLNLSALPSEKRYEIFSVGVDGSGQSQLTNNVEFDSYPSSKPSPC